MMTNAAEPLHKNELFRFENTGVPGYGSIGCENEKWYAFAFNGKAMRSKWLPNKEAAESVIEKIRSNPAKFKIIADKM